MDVILEGVCVVSGLVVVGLCGEVMAPRIVVVAILCDVLDNATHFAGCVAMRPTLGAFGCEGLCKGVGDRATKTRVSALCCVEIPV